MEAHPLTIKVINHYHKVFPEELQEQLEDAIQEGEPTTMNELLKEEYECNGLDHTEHKKNVRQDCCAMINRFDYEAFKTIDTDTPVNLEVFISKVYGLTEEQDIGCMIYMLTCGQVFRLDTRIDFKKLCAFHMLSRYNITSCFITNVYHRYKHEYPDKTQQQIHKILNKQYAEGLGYKQCLIDFIPYDSKTHISDTPAEFNIEVGGVIDLSTDLKNKISKLYTYIDPDKEPKKILKSKSSDISVNMKLKNIHFDMVYEKCYPESDYGKNYKHKSDLRKKFFNGEERTIFTSGNKIGKERIDYQLVMFNRLFQLEMNTMYE